MDSDSQFNEIYEKLKKAGLLDIEIIMEIEARKFGLAFNKTQVGYGELLERCRGATLLTQIEASDGTYQRKLKKLSDPDKLVEDKPFSKDPKAGRRGKYNINFEFIDKDVEQRTKGLVPRVLKPYDIILEHKNFASSWDLRDYDYVHKLFQQIQIASNHGEDDIVDELSRGYERKIMRKYEGAYIPDMRQDPAPFRGCVF